LHLLSHLYAQRSSPIWKEEASWFESTVIAEFSSLPASLPVTNRRQDFLSLYENANLRYSVYRHVMVLETTYRRLFSYIPQEVLNVKALQCDPLPPPTAVTSYDDAFFEGTEDLRTFMPAITTRQRAQQGRVLAQMIPDAGVREQLQVRIAFFAGAAFIGSSHSQAFFNAMPAVQARFPEGVVQFAEAAAQMDPEEFEALMLAAAMGNEDGAERGGMPGEMPGFPHWEPEAQEPAREQEAVGEGEGDNESSDDEEEEVVAVSFSLQLLPFANVLLQPLPLRVLRNVISRFWGGNADADDSSSEDGDPLDTAGVD
jgi:hypothetical protein